MPAATCSLTTLTRPEKKVKKSYICLLTLCNLGLLSLTMKTPNTTANQETQDWTFDDETRHIAEGQEIAEEDMEEEIW